MGNIESIKIEIDQLIEESFKTRLKDVNKAIDLATSACSKSKEINCDERYSKATLKLAHFNMMLSNFDKSIELSIKSLNVFDGLNHLEGKADSFYIIGNTYLKMGKLEEGLVELLKALEIYKSLDLEEGEAKTHNSIGYVYKSFNELENALKSYNRNLEISIKKNDINGQSNSYNHLAEISITTKEYNKGLEYVNKSIPMKREAGDTRGLGVALYTKGYLLIKTEEWNEAEKYLFEAIDVLSGVNDVYQIALCDSKLGSVFFNLKKMSLAKEHLLKAKSVADDINAKEVQYDINYHLYLISDYEGDFKEALKYYKQFHSLKEDVVNNNAAMQIKSQQVAHQSRMAEIERKKTEELKIAYAEIERKNAETEESLNYAKSLQEAILPTELQIQSFFRDAFVLFLPRDIVSGDFYWVHRTETKMLIAAVDCTGHGVPGAFMSMIGNNLLSYVVREQGITKPSEILNELRKRVVDTLNRNDGINRKDGMDMSLCSIELDGSSLEFAGAYNSLFLIRKRELIEIKADRFPVGLVMNSEMQDFTNRKVDLEKGDRIYMLSDGFPDQFGGEKNKKFMIKRFKNLLVDNHEQAMLMQKSILLNTLKNWQGEEEQVDDILVLGLHF